MGNLTRLCHKLIEFSFSGTGSGVLDCDWRSQKWRWLVLLLDATCLAYKRKCTISTKISYCWFLFCKGNIKHVRANLALFTVGETRIFVSWQVNTLLVCACWTKHISNIILNWFLRLFKNLNPLVILQEKRKCLLFRNNIAHLTRRLAFKTVVITSFRRLKSLFAHA